MTTLLSLPLRTPILDGEGLDSWIAALARRNQIPARELLRALGIDYPHLTNGQLLDHTSPARLRHIEAATGLPGHRLDSAIGAALASAMRHRPDGSRYCPACLGETGGRWQLVWRAKWSVACLRHHALLQDTCPGCDRMPRGGPISASREQSATGCTQLLDTENRTRCDTDLAAAGQVNATTDAIEAQTWSETLLDHAHGPSGDHARQSLTDLHPVCGWLRSNDENTLIEAADRIQPGRVDRRRSHDSSGGDAALTAAALVRAKTILGSDDDAALAAIGHLVSVSGSANRIPPPGMQNPVWSSATPRFKNRYLRAVDADLAPTERLRLKTTLPSAALPGDQPPTRARMIPQLIWPDWAGPLLPAEGHWADLHRAVMSAALLIPGHPERSQHDIAQFNPRVNRATIAVPLRGFDTVIAALARIANYLDQHGTAIDYQHRRDQIPAETIERTTWRELACSVDAHPGGDDRTRLRSANRYLHQLLTGADLADPRHPLAFTNSDDRSHHLRFTVSMSMPLRQALRDYATTVLEQLGIDEPLTWSPPTTLARDLDLPGVDIAQLDMDKIEQLVIIDNHRLVDVADILGVHIEHIRFALERLDRPQRPWSRSAPPAAWLRKRQAEKLLTREFFEREHLQKGRRIKELSATTGFSITELSRYARQHGITIRKGQAPARIDPGWLREQYLDRRRNMTDIATELGMAQGAVANALGKLGIPARPSGVASWTETNLTHDDLPAGVRAAVEGTYNGWKRLRHFQIAMQFPMLKPAAQHLGIVPSVLAIQLELLEQHVGGTLFIRYNRPTAQQPTVLGQALLDDLATEPVQAHMNAAIGSDDPPTPASEDLAHLRPFDGLAVLPLSLDRGRNRLLRIITDHGPDNEFCCIEIAHTAAAATSTVNRLLKQMAAANWATRRPETETERTARLHNDSRARQRIYYRLTPDGYQAAVRSLQPRESDKPMGKQRRQTSGKTDGPHTK
ncbi:TniQ family protein [Nocardia africana]|uniref:Bacterial regulatory helix-turn-helix protein, lysR family n=1 Tax=Nocardia africana TaxID=134964 RepID=A0A378X2X3_9NOCA|nr:TniQ family protein [Nocardia africana]MCC3318314.1 TniQ family protein [Nocardia africana]SUA47377.1 Bacterial regulatory helix-turn-helix protein, lysR family [Nocardia africana]